jgi:integrase
MGMIGRLTANKLKTAKPHPDGRPRMMCDGGNLWLVVRRGKSGNVTKSWLFRYLSPTLRRERQMGLGSADTLALTEAREKAREARIVVLNGQDPLDAKNASRAAAVRQEVNCVTFDEKAEEYLQRFEDKWRNRHHRRQWRNTLRDYISPVIGHMDVMAITTDHVLACLMQTAKDGGLPLWERVPETASRVRGRIETILDFADRNGSNPARWEILKFKLADPNRHVRHLPAVAYNDMPAFMVDLRAVESIAARALEFTILTAARTGEVLGAQWSEIDWTARTWRIPRHRLKRKGEEEDGSHTIPLSDPAMRVLEQMAAVRQGDRIFRIRDDAMRFCLRDLRPGVVPHGFRSSFRSWSGGCSSHPRDVCETALGHVVGSEVERTYQRDGLLAKREAHGRLGRILWLIRSGCHNRHN